MNILRDARLEFLDPDEAGVLVSSRKEGLKIGPSARVLPTLEVKAEYSREETESLAATAARVALTEVDHLVVYLSDPILIAYRHPRALGIKRGHLYATDVRQMSAGSLLLLAGQITKVKGHYCLTADQQILYSLSRQAHDASTSEYGLYDIEVHRNEILPPHKLFFTLNGSWADRFKYESIHGMVFAKVLGTDNPTTRQFVRALRLEIKPIFIFTAKAYEDFVTRLVANVREHYTGDAVFPSLSIFRVKKSTKDELKTDYEQLSLHTVSASRIIGRAIALQKGRDDFVVETVRVFSDDTSREELREAVSVLQDFGNNVTKSVNRFAVAIWRTGIFRYEEMKHSIMTCFRWIIASSVHPYSPNLVAHDVYNCSSAWKTAFFSNDPAVKPFIAYLPEEIVTKFGLMGGVGRRIESSEEMHELLVDYVFPQNYRRILKEELSDGVGCFQIDWYSLD